MSEYPYHEWQTVDRALTHEEQMDVEELLDISRKIAAVYDDAAARLKKLEQRLLA